MILHEDVIDRHAFKILVGALFFLATVTNIAFGASINHKDCASNKKLFEQISCYTAAAKAANDLTSCDQTEHDGVRYQCYAIYAEYSTSPDVCSKIPATTDVHRSHIDICLSDVAKKAGNPNLCERIVSPGLCDSCYLKLANQLDNPGLCTKIRHTSLKNTCSGVPILGK